MDIGDCIFFAMTSSARQAGKFWKQQVAELGVTGVQALVLNALGQQDQITAVQLGRQVRLDSATMTGVLDRLEQSQLIERLSDLSDRRAIRIRLTAAGSALTEILQQRLEEANRAYTRNLSEAEVKTLKELLGRL